MFELPPWREGVHRRDAECAEEEAKLREGLRERFSSSGFHSLRLRGEPGKNALLAQWQSTPLITGRREVRFLHGASMHR